MIGLDTNILVRYLTKDDPRQAPFVTDFIQQHCTNAKPCMISLVVLCELAWVLKSRYGINRKNLLNVIEKLLLTSQFKVVNLL